MQLQEIIKKIKHLEICTRQIVETTFTGAYHSVFKGLGVNFTEVREYQEGDDVRAIDWNVTAKMGYPYVKLYEEERELTVMLLVDLSASGNFGTGQKSKAEIAAEIAAVLGFSANNNHDRVGLILFSDRVEKYVPPKRGKDHVFLILRDIFYYQPKSKLTSIASALQFLMRVQKKKVIVFVISDFLDEGYARDMQMLARKHDVVPIIISDVRERQFPNAGIVLFEDEETAERVVIDTRFKTVRDRLVDHVQKRQAEQTRFFNSIDVLPIRIETHESYTESLQHYFRARAKKQRIR